MPAKRSNNQRGYGAHHQRMRRRYLAEAIGTPCHYCGQPMLEGQALDLDHTDDRNGYRGMTHASCNRRAGAHKRWDNTTTTSKLPDGTVRFPDGTTITGATIRATASRYIPMPNPDHGFYDKHADLVVSRRWYGDE